MSRPRPPGLPAALATAARAPRQQGGWSAQLPPRWAWQGWAQKGWAAGEERGPSPPTAHPLTLQMTMPLLPIPGLGPDKMVAPGWRAEAGLGRWSYMDPDAGLTMSATSPPGAGRWPLAREPASSES